MDSTDLKVVLVTKKDILDYLRTPALKREYNLPFSDNKAQWLVEKPGMEDGDFCAIMATTSKEILSFTHLVPDILSQRGNHTQEDRKIYWMPQWWASETAKSTVVSTYVFSESLKATHHKVLVKAYEQNAEAFYAKQPFTVVQTYLRHVVFIGLASDVLAQKLPVLGKIKFIAKGLEKTSVKLYSWLNRARINKLGHDLKIKYLHQLDTDSWDFIEPLVQNDLVQKNREYINWQIDQKQYLSTPLDKRKSNIGLIRGYGSKIGMVNYMLTRGDAYIGFVSFHYIGHTAYLKYGLAHLDEMGSVCATLYEHMIKLGITYFFTDNASLAKHFLDNFSTVYHYTQTKKSMAHNSIHEMVRDAVVTEQDGHFI
ncbi:GNAT family protein [Flagellimonas baculiformis]|uniref:hypothetical protein n=1 Tax=Flagellimonas baculiformis TaxID=3067310 RepID=UPI00296E439A|nr:hypothetical protein [Muricauda sp. D6]